MKRLFVLFDQECGLCRSCCLWLQRQPAFLALEFIPLQSPDLAVRFPGIEAFHLRERLVVISDEGAVYQGEYAWVMCLYALQDYREWARRLAHPALLPFAHRVCELVSRNRLALSSAFFKQRPARIARQLGAMPPPLCETEPTCSI